jgi:hypothetical protein
MVAGVSVDVVLSMSSLSILRTTEVIERIAEKAYEDPIQNVDGACVGREHTLGPGNSPDRG